MSMLNQLKKNTRNAVFVDDDDSVDNMDYPLPSDFAAQNESMQQLQNMMKQLSANEPPKTSSMSVASGPHGVKSMDPSEYKDWICIYPCYLDAERHVSEGRKIPASVAVPHPHAYHIAECARQLGFSVVYEGKRHPRDWENPGRVRVQLKHKNNMFVDPNIITRKQLFHAIAARLPVVQKECEVPPGIVSPLTHLAQIDSHIQDQRRTQGNPFSFAQASASS